MDLKQQQLDPARLALRGRLEDIELHQYGLWLAASYSTNSPAVAAKLLRQYFGLEISPTLIDVERRHLADEARRRIAKILADRKERGE